MAKRADVIEGADAYMDVLLAAYTRQYREATDEWTDDLSMRCVPALVQGRLKLPPAARALDVGCGTGRDVDYLAGFLGSVTGIDIVAHEAWDGIVRQRAGAVAFERTDLLSFRAPGRFDLVLDNGCFHHQHERHRDRYLATVASFVGAGGWFVLSTFKSTTRQSYFDANGRLHTYFDDGELRALLGAAGFDAVDEIDLYRPTKGNYYRVSFCRPATGRC